MLVIPYNMDCNFIWLRSRELVTHQLACEKRNLSSSAGPPPISRYLPEFGTAHESLAHGSETWGSIYVGVSGSYDPLHTPERADMATSLPAPALMIPPRVDLDGDVLGLKTHEIAKAATGTPS
jgi:hypothetical protein